MVIVLEFFTRLLQNALLILIELYWRKEDDMSELKALLFDVDGTLADTEKDGHRVAFNLAFKQAGLDWDWDAALYGELLAVTGAKSELSFILISLIRVLQNQRILMDL